MSLFSRSCAGACAVGVVVAMAAGPVLAQGKSAGRAGGPSGAMPVPSGKPATPPGQAKQPPAGAVNHGSSAKPVTPIVVKPALAARLQPILPPGTNVDAAAAGFRNLGQFVAAAHVSQNLDIPFTALKTEMIDHGQTLGKAIQTLKPAANTKTEVSHAEAQAKADLDEHAK